MISTLANLADITDNFTFLQNPRINSQDQIACNRTFANEQTACLLTPVLAAVPHLDTVSPATVSQGAQNVTLTLTGTGFETDSLVSINGGTPRPAHYVSPTKMTFALPSNETSTETMRVGIYTPPAGGGSSNAIDVHVVAPKITSITPDRFDPESVNATVTVTGLNFTPGSVVTINDVYTVTPTVLSTTQLTAILPSSVTGTPGEYFVRVVNPGWSDYSAPVRLTIGQKAPTVSSLSPNRVPVGVSNLSLYVYGTGITAGSKVSFSNGPLVTPTSIQANRLVVSVPAAVLARRGAYQVRIVNSIAEGGYSAPTTFEVAARPVLTAVTPNSINAGSDAVTVTLTGGNFEAGSVVTINDTYTVTPTLVSSNKMTIVLPSAVSSTAGAYFARVINPGYANNSSPMRFTVTAAN
ncbi:MAG: IPT/TIG domain-containing protein [Capsulimonas sp.]|uniref:IPT/TIG domain-containing protein n=1 Tax=Capsulimonas sp. TaxID=2494211 RepID=UPI003264C439